MTRIAIYRINKSSLDQFFRSQVSFPSLAEQEKIGTFFQAQDEGISALTEEIGKLKNMKQACLAQMFV